MTDIAFVREEKEKAKSGVVPYPELLIIHSVNLYSKFGLLSCRTKKVDLCTKKFHFVLKRPD